MKSGFRSKNSGFHPNKWRVGFHVGKPALVLKLETISWIKGFDH